ncbi:hypothetical protein B296_00039351 [Ensete ventricosum]|uniref:Uncharacterized protein n=1 Tax=Ensete ventricosum TaxID=4639 RepID=A0A426YDE6_ENSVE|nr:hypothetical protein B296_00039351 [Ensete ventricosum]
MRTYLEVTPNSGRRFDGQTLWRKDLKNFRVCEAILVKSAKPVARWQRRGNNSGGRRGEAGEGAASMVEMVEATIEEKATTAAEGDGAIDSWEEKKEGSGGKQVEQWLRRARQGVTGG